MSGANELLETLTDGGTEMYTADPATEPHIVIGKDKFIVVPEELKRIAVQFEHNIETVTFDCPRFWDDNDLTEMKVYINYTCPGGIKGSYLADNVRVDEANTDLIHFEWKISRNVTLVDGTLAILACATTTDENGEEVNRWSSEINKEMYVSEGMNCTDEVLSQRPDFMTRILEIYDDISVKAAVYVGPGEMPPGYNVQIDPTATDGPVLTLKDEAGNIVAIPAISGWSAYQIAQYHGFEGTEEEWLASLGADCYSKQECDEKYAGKSILVHDTISSWSDVVTYSNENITMTSIVEILPGVDITIEQLKALQEANIVDGGQSEGGIRLKLLGKIPTIAIPVTFIIRRDM